MKKVAEMTDDEEFTDGFYSTESEEDFYSDGADASNFNQATGLRQNVRELELT